MLHTAAEHALRATKTERRRRIRSRDVLYSDTPSSMPSSSMPSIVLYGYRQQLYNTVPRYTAERHRILSSASQRIKDAGEDGGTSL
jgi:hypothetical protein